MAHADLPAVRGGAAGPAAAGGAGGRLRAAGDRDGGRVHGVYPLSKRTTAGRLADLFGVELAVGSVTACERAASAAVATPVVQAVRHVRQQPVIHVDETGWRQRRQRAWLRVAATTLVTMFLVHARRGTGAARVLLRGTPAILVTDRWSAYQACNRPAKYIPEAGSRGGSRRPTGGRRRAPPSSSAAAARRGGDWDASGFARGRPRGRPREDLHPIPAAIPEDKEMACQGILMEHVAGQGRQAIERQV